MTGRELIKRILETKNDLDEEIRLEVWYRDEHDCVVRKTEAQTFHVMLHGIVVEGNTLLSKEI